MPARLAVHCRQTDCFLSGQQVASDRSAAEHTAPKSTAAPEQSDHHPGNVASDRSAAEPTAPKSTAAPEQSSNPPAAGDWQAAFAEVMRPLLAHPRPPAGGAVVTEALSAQLLTQTGRRLATVSARVLVAELHRQRVAGTLEGDDPAASFASFIRRLTTGTALAELLGRYPALERLVRRMAADTAEADGEMLNRFAADRPALVETLLGGQDPGDLVEALSAGDPHHGGRRVALLRFESGTRVVYKPRGLGLHARFNEFVAWLNDLTGLGLRTVRLVTREGYGWMEYIEHRAASDIESVKRFYQRQGALLALLYVLDGTDMHFENLIAADDQPVLVDVETLFHPSALEQPVTGIDPADLALRESVLRTALLPLVVGGEHGVVDLSGLGGDTGTQAPQAVATWVDAGLDTMRLVRVAGTVAGGQNRPYLDGVAVEPRDHQASILAGFVTACDAIEAGRAQMLAPGGLLARCEPAEVRVVIRPTMIYAGLLAESTHPSLTADPAGRREYFNSSLHDPTDAYAPLLPYELDALERGDIPLFTTRAGSCDVHLTGGTVVPGLLPASGLARAEKKIRELGEVKRELQEWLIAAALATRPEAVDHHHWESRRLRPATAPADPQRLLSAATWVADEIVGQALGKASRVNWIVLELVGDLHWTVAPAGAGLPQGYLGIALFLAEMSRVSGISRFAELACEVLTPMPTLLEAWAGRPETLRAIGPGYNGIGGICYALSRLCALGVGDRSEECLAAAVGLAGRLAEDPEPAGDWDVANGDAGGLAAMTAIEGSARTDALLFADRYADRLAAAVGEGLPAIAGFQRGLHGVAWALRRHPAATDLQLAAARQALTRAQHARATSEAPGWCVGRAGMLAASDGTHTDDDQVEDFVRDSAVRPPLTDLSLCHGELGALEPLVRLANRGRQNAAAVLRDRTALIVSAIEQDGPRCGTPRGIRSPGLLSGLAGIGYGLIRLGLPGMVPSVLFLEPGGHGNTANPEEKPHLRQGG